MYQGKFKAKTSNNHPACIKLQKLVTNITSTAQSQFQDKIQRKHIKHLPARFILAKGCSDKGCIASVSLATSLIQSDPYSWGAVGSPSSAE